MEDKLVLHQLKQLELKDVIETDVELGRGAYGVVVEVRVKGLRYVCVCVGLFLNFTNSTTARSAHGCEYAVNLTTDFSQ